MFHIRSWDIIELLKATITAYERNHDQALPL
jgi:hypothetical protein